MLTKLLHIILAVLVFISSAGLVVSKHYCKGELKSMALFGEASTCHSDKRMKSCPLHAGMLLSDDEAPIEKGCCDTETELNENHTEQAEMPLEYILSDHSALFITLVVLAGFEPVTTDKKTDQYLTYKPPPLVCDLPVRLQAFLL